MDKRIFYFLHEYLTAENAGQCDLKIVIGTDGIALRAFDSGNRTVALQAWQFSGNDQEMFESELRRILSGEKTFSYAYANVSCAVYCPYATLVPKRLFSTEDLSAYFKILLPPGEALAYGFDELPEYGCFLVWAAEPALLRLCAQYFPAGPTVHLAVPLLRAYQSLASGGGHEVFVNLRAQSAQIIVFERQNLLFYNTFQFSKPADLLYFILLIYDQFRLNPLDIPMTLSGDLLEDSDIFRLLHRYVHHIRFAPLPPSARLPEGIENLPGYYWFELFNL